LARLKLQPWELLAALHELAQEYNLSSQRFFISAL
jgi:hypothetical protein